MSFRSGVTAPKMGSVVGKGSHSLMYKSKVAHPDTGDSVAVALKEYSVPAQTDPEGVQAQLGAVERLKEVGDQLTTLAPHKHLARVYGIEFVKGSMHRELDRVLVTQDYIESQSKGTKGPLEEGELRVVARGLVAAVAHLHTNGITHDDIRPCNVFRSLTSCSNGEQSTDNGTTPNVLVTDYSLFKPVTMLLDPSTGQVTTQQRPQYTSPEVFTDGSDYDPFKVDVWAIGACLVELLTGKPPYYELDPKGTGAIMFKIINGRKPPSYGASCSEGLRSFLDACFTWSSDDRPSIEELMEHRWLS